MTGPFLSVVVPAYNCASLLRRTLAALAASDLPRRDWELSVADDGSTDDTSQVARDSADQVVRVAGGPKGPGAARNAGAAVAAGEVLVFVDADVCVSRTALGQFATLFRHDAALGAAFGAYDLAPEATNLVSQYRNLLHHRVHSANPGPAITFWAGCGAIRRAAFVQAGGYDAERYRRPQIEDIELGYRLSALGYRIDLRPEIQGCHLKRWTLKGGIVTDFRDRGVPWMRLLLERQEIAAGGPLNLRRREKVFTLLAPLGLLSAAGSLAFNSPLLGTLGIISFAVVIAGNAPLIRWFARVRGWRFAIAVVPFRILYYSLNACSAGWAILAHLRDRRRSSIVRGRVPQLPAST
jgi:hypothetical protein